MIITTNIKNSWPKEGGLPPDGNPPDGLFLKKPDNFTHCPKTQNARQAPRGFAGAQKALNWRTAVAYDP
jgi:hypothetical protein